jgi:hypothetical protein
MSTIINATTTNGVVIQPDNSGSLVLQTNSGTTALTIDTSQRAAFVAGTAAAPAITTTGDTNTGIFFPAADTIAFAEGGTEVVRIDSSGNVSIGVQTANARLELAKTSGVALRLNDLSTNYWEISNDSNLIFNRGGTERMRIDSSGAVNINRTSGGGKLNVTGDLWLYAITAGAGNSTLKYNSGTGQVTYDASSRYYKENIQDLEYGLSSVMAMKPRKYVYKATGVIDIGFIADEMLPLVPEITPLANNSINDMGVPDGEPFTVNYDRLTAVLVKAIQEQQTIINDLKARIETLEAK